MQYINTLVPEIGMQFMPIKYFTIYINTLYIAYKPHGYFQKYIILYYNKHIVLKYVYLIKVEHNNYINLTITIINLFFTLVSLHVRFVKL